MKTTATLLFLVQMLATLSAGVLLSDDFADDSLDAKFLSEAEMRGLCNLKGHRSVGGMRASIYNAMPEAGIDALVEFMAEFEKVHG